MHKLVGLGVIIFALAVSLIASNPARAATDSSVVITEVLTGTSLSASAEFVELHNRSPHDVDVENWKIQYLSANGTSITVKATLHGLLRANGFMFAGTTDYTAPPDITLTAGMPETGGRLRLVNATGDIVDSLSWGAGTIVSEGSPAQSPLRAQSITRIMESGIFRDTDNNAADFSISDTPLANGGDVLDPVDMCPNEDRFPGIQSVVPAGYYVDDQGGCIPIPIEYSRIILNEILPDPASPKTDASDEYIELYNPTDVPVDIAGYKLASGANLGSVYVLSSFVIAPHGYLVLYSSETKIALSNSGSKVQLLSPDGSPMGDTLEYGAANANQAWAYFNDGWKLSDKPTPGSMNELVVSEEPAGGDIQGVVAPCPSGKYRHPLTNRCRNIETDASILAACEADEYRSPETNRCRKFTLASASIASCQAGYERNIATNRCRKIVASTGGLKPCGPGQERSPQTNRCRKSVSQAAATSIDPKPQGFNIVGGVALGIVGLGAVSYGVYEWRNEIAGAFGRLVAALGKK